MNVDANDGEAMQCEKCRWWAAIPIRSDDKDEPTKGVCLLLTAECAEPSADIGVIHLPPHSAAITSFDYGCIHHNATPTPESTP